MRLRCLMFALGCLGPAARADVMHWFWDVEVNGHLADESRPVPVEAGDRVEIALWADFDPYRAGFAAAVCAIDTDDALFLTGDVNIDPAEGYGLNPDLLALGENGMIVDSDASGAADVIDAIVGFQLARGWGGNFDPSNPIRVYRFGWTLTDTPSGEIRLHHSPTLDGQFSSSVYLDDFGNAVEYPTASDVLVIVPAPSVVLICAAGASPLGTRRRRSGRSLSRKELSDDPPTPSPSDLTHSSRACVRTHDMSRSELSRRL